VLQKFYKTSVSVFNLLSLFLKGGTGVQCICILYFVMNVVVKCEVVKFQFLFRGSICKSANCYAVTFRFSSINPEKCSENDNDVMMR
jgi:hypothetical protein